MPRNKNKKHKIDQYRFNEKVAYASGRKNKKKNKKKSSNYNANLQLTRFLDQLLPLGLCIRTVTSDDNSLFRAIADQIIGHESSHHQIRKEIVEYMTSNPDEFSPFYIGDFNEYLSELIQPGIHGGNMELTAASKHYKMDIVIHQLNTARYELLYVTGKPQSSIHLSYHNQRDYASVRLLNDMKSFMPAKPIDLKENNEEKIEREQQRTEIASHNDNNNPMNVINDKQLEMENEIIMARTGCYDITKVQTALKYSNNDIDKAVQWILSEEKNNALEDLNDAKDDNGIVDNVKKMGDDIGLSGVVCHCGQTNENNFTFCTNCGWDLSYEPLLDNDTVNVTEAAMINSDVSGKCACGSGKKAKKCCLKRKSWACGKCSLINKYNKFRCEVCGNPRERNMYMPNRNNGKCHCGSGKKYRKCCKKIEKIKKYVGRNNYKLKVKRDTDRLLAKFDKINKKRLSSNSELKLDNNKNELINEVTDETKEVENDENKCESIDIVEENKYIEQLKKIHMMEMNKKQQEIDVLKLENEQLKERMDLVNTHKVNMEKECIFCMDAYRSFAFVPCGHLSLCHKCKDLAKETCPICQNKYTSLIRIYS